MVGTSGNAHPFDSVVASLYEAAAEPRRWPEALTTVADLLESAEAHLLLWNKRHNAPESLSTGRISRNCDGSYVQHYGVVDPRQQLDECLSTSRWWCHEHVDGAGISRDGVQDDLAPRCAHFVAATCLFDEADTAAFFDLHRDQRQGPFRDDDLTALQRLQPHLARSARLHYRLARRPYAAGVAQVALDRLPFALFVVDAHGSILTHNRAAEAIVAAVDGVVVRNGHLTTVRPGEASALAAHIARAGASGALPRNSGSAAISRSLRTSQSRYFAITCSRVPSRPITNGLPHLPGLPI